MPCRVKCAYQLSNRFNYYYRSANPKPKATGHTPRAPAATSAGPTKVCSLVLYHNSSNLKYQTCMLSLYRRSNVQNSSGYAGFSLNANSAAWGHEACKPLDCSIQSSRGQFNKIQISASRFKGSVQQESIRGVPPPMLSVLSAKLAEIPPGMRNCKGRNIGRNEIYQPDLMLGYKALAHMKPFGPGLVIHISSSAHARTCLQAACDRAFIPSCFVSQRGTIPAAFF